jgi:hypothetical protein
VKADHEQILNLWADPAEPTAQEISELVGACRGHVCNIILRARDRGDQRAVKRKVGRRKQNVVDL